MAKKDQLIKFIFDYFGKDFLDKAQNKDDYVNGLQINGKEDVQKVALGVSANLGFLEKCRNWGADFIIVHHGIHLGSLKHYVNPILEKRLRLLFDSKMTLMAFHYCLDAHIEIGNNAQTLKKIGAKIVEPFFDEWGWVGGLPNPLEIETVISNLTKIFSHQPTKFLYGKKKIERVAVVSGGGAPRGDEIAEFLEKKVDLYVTGETRESTPALIKEMGINYLAFGHYDTEKLGVQGLGKVIEKKLSGVTVKFIDTPNPF